MAQRQGLLVGGALSPVRFSAAQILQWAEDLASGKQTAERVKLALVARNDPGWVPWNLFPERIAAPTSESVDAEEAGSLDVDTEEGRLGVDYSGVTFKGSESIEEFDRLMRQVASFSSGSFSGTELRGPDKGWL